MDAQPNASEVHPASRAPEDHQVSLSVALDLEISSLLAALLAVVLLIVTTVIAVVPGLAMGIYFSAQATPYVPPPWASLFSGTGPTWAGSPSISVALTVVIILLVGGSLALAFRGLVRLRRDTATRSPKDRTLIGRATYLLAGATAAAVLFVVWILLAFEMAVSSMSPTVTPASFVSGAQVGLAVLGGVLAVTFAGGTVLLVTFQRTMRSLVSGGTSSPLSETASLFVLFGTAFYFTVIMTPYVDSTTFTTALYIVGGENGPWVWLTLPCWLFVGAGFALFERDWFRLRAGSHLPGDEVGITSTAFARHQRRPSRSVVTVLAVATLVTLGILAGPSAGSSYGVLAHTECVGGVVLAQETRWTPMLIINSPYGGNATGSWTLLDPDGTGWGQWSSTATNGSTNVMAILNNWTVYAAHTQLAAGPGSDAPCTSPYLAIASPAAFSIQLSTRLTPPTPYSDQNLPREFNQSINNPASPVNASSVIFFAGYGAYPNATYSNCPGGATVGWAESSELVRFSVPFKLNGVNEFATTTLASLTNYTYTSSMPGTYHVQDLGTEPSTFGSGLAFSYTPC